MVEICKGETIFGGVLPPLSFEPVAQRGYIHHNFFNEEAFGLKFCTSSLCGDAPFVKSRRDAFGIGCCSSQLFPLFGLEPRDNLWRCFLLCLAGKIVFAYSH